MLKTLITVTTVLLTTVAFAQSNTKSSGSSTKSPGHQMQKSKTSTAPGASEYAPGHKMQKSKVQKSKTSTAPGASEYAPGKTTTGSATPTRTKKKY